MVPAVTDGLMTADMTAQQSAAYWRTVLTATARTVKTIRPTQLTEVFPAIFVATKPRVEFLKVSRIVFHALAYYGLYAGESSGYPVHIKLTAERRMIRTLQQRAIFLSKIHLESISSALHRS